MTISFERTLMRDGRALLALPPPDEHLGRVPVACASLMFATALEQGIRKRLIIASRGGVPEDAPKTMHTRAKRMLTRPFRERWIYEPIRIQLLSDRAGAQSWRSFPEVLRDCVASPGGSLSQFWPLGGLHRAVPVPFRSSSFPSGLHQRSLRPKGSVSASYLQWDCPSLLIEDRGEKCALRRVVEADAH
jgi:hypothetical protein